MKAKVILLALLMSMGTVLPSYSMEDENVVEILIERLENGGGGPRTGVPITASIDNGIITTYYQLIRRSMDNRIAIVPAVIIWIVIVHGNTRKLAIVGNSILGDICHRTWNVNMSKC